MLINDFTLHDQDVKIGLQKFEYIHGIYLYESDWVRLLKLLPNLKTLGIIQRLSVLMPIIRDDDEIRNKLSIITEFNDLHTSLTTLEYVSKLCPKTKKLALQYPKKKVIENLCKFPLLSEIQLRSRDAYFVSELISLLNIIGKQIKILTLYFPEDGM